MGKLRKFLCTILDWHSPAFITRGEVNSLGLCKYCHRKIMQDSQGNWFSC